MLVRLKTSLTVGTFFGLFSVLYTVVEAICLFIVELIFPVSEIDILPSFNPHTTIELEHGECKQYSEDPLVYGNHLFRINSLSTHSRDCTAYKNNGNET